MASPTELRQRIDEIDAILRTGATSVALDGVTISYNFPELRRERDELQKQLGATTNRRRRIFYHNKLG